MDEKYVNVHVHVLPEPDPTYLANNFVDFVLKFGLYIWMHRHFMGSVTEGGTGRLITGEEEPKGVAHYFLKERTIYLIRGG